MLDEYSLAFIPNARSFSCSFVTSWLETCAAQVTFGASNPSVFEVTPTSTSFSGHKLPN